MIGALAAEHRMALDGSLDDDTGSRALDDRRADEHRVERSAVDPVDVEVGLERVALTPVAVAPHRDVDRPERALVGAAVECFGGEQDHPRARPEHRQAVGEARREGVEETGRLEQQRHRRRFAARHHERVDSGQIRRLTYLDGLRAELSQDVSVGGERALQRQHSHLHLVASRSSRRPTNPARPA